MYFLLLYFTDSLYSGVRGGGLGPAPQPVAQEGHQTYDCGLTEGSTRVFVSLP